MEVRVGEKLAMKKNNGQRSAVKKD